MISITHIKWGEKKIGIASHKMLSGNNVFEVTAEGKDGQRYYPGIFSINKAAAIERYGEATINKNGLKGVWVPLKDLELYREA